MIDANKKRKAFFAAKNMVHVNGSDTNKLCLHILSNNYKQQLRIEHRLYFKMLYEQIKSF